jgi:fimbrial isopeptide formation D2 family protein
MHSNHIVSALGAGLLGLLASAGPALAAPLLVKQVDQHGDMILIGNTLGQNCQNPPESVTVGTVGPNCAGNVTAPNVLWCASDDNAQVQADISCQPGTQRSTAVLSLPAGATVNYAWIFFAASVDDIDNPGTTATLDRPGDPNFAAVQLTPDQDPDPNNLSINPTRTTPYGDFNAQNAQTAFAYQTRANVTDIVKEHGSGAYRVGGFNVSTFPNQLSDNAFVGWWMVVFYELQSEPQRHLALYDAFDSVSNTGGGQGVQSTLTGFLIPPGSLEAKLGVVAWEGDQGFTQDSLYFGSSGEALVTPLSNDLNPSDNFFNSTRSQAGPGVPPAAVAVSNDGDLPQLTGLPGSMSGIDIDVVDVSDKLQAGADHASLIVTTGNDSFVLGGYVLSTLILAPDFGGSTKVAVDNTQRVAGAVLPGDTLTYTIVATNVGNDTATTVRLTDTLPAEVACIGGSIHVVKGGNDITATANAACNDNTLTLELPDFLQNDSVTVTFQVTVNEGAVGTISNQATITCDNKANAANPLTFITTSDANNAGSKTDTPIDQCTTDGDAAPCTDPQKPICNTTVHPFECVQCVGDTDCAGGQLCDEATNTCQAPQSCSTDSECGTTTSGHVCDDASKTCKSGCRGQGGNGCPIGNTCSSTTSDIGVCQAGTPCNTDSECGGANSGRVCSDTAKVCQSGCRGQGGNGCVSGDTCSSTTAAIGTCSGTGQSNSVVLAGGACSAGPESSDSSNSTLLLAGTVAAVVAAARRRSSRRKSMHDKA